jgi:hypothetical protein
MLSSVAFACELPGFHCIILIVNLKKNNSWKQSY